MSDKQAQVSRYAQAVFQIMVERWQSALSDVATALNQDPQLTALLSDASKDASVKVTAVENVLPKTLPAEVGNFVKLLTQEGDLALLPQISSALTQTASGRRGPLKAEVTSAAELSEREQADIRAKLAQDYGEGMSFTFSVDPALMGGLRVRVGDTLIDTSVASRLARLRESLSSVVR